jgi:adenylate cyclase
MESSGKPGRIHISETTYWRVKDRFECEPCGLIDVKGIGPIPTFLLKAEKAPIPMDGASEVEGRATADNIG